MVRGLDIFREFFSGMEKNYVIIGGTACNIHEEGMQQEPRATKDIDIILIVEALSEDIRFSLPPKMRTDLSLFLDTIEKELPGKELFKAMKLPRLNAEELVEKIRKIFQL